MSWTWYDPTVEEAEEAYSYYRGRYAQAAQEYNAYKQQVDNLSYQKNAVSSQIGNYSSQKLNLEKRLEGVIKIIGMLTGGSATGVSVPDMISKASKVLNETSESFKKSIVLMGGIAAADIAVSFAIKSVEADPHSSAALQQYKNERNRLEQEIETIRQTIVKLSDSLSSISSSINNAYSLQISAKNAMNSYAYEMHHYSRYRFG